MKRFTNIAALIVTILAIGFTVTSCGGGGAKVAKSLQKVVSSKAAGKTVKGIGRCGDDVLRHVSTKTVTCSTCAGLKQVDFIDDDGTYLYTGECPDCDGKGTVTKYEFK